MYFDKVLIKNFGLLQLLEQFSSDAYRQRGLEISNLDSLLFLCFGRYCGFVSVETEHFYVKSLSMNFATHCWMEVTDGAS